jgi:hypothetical protein
MLNLFAPPAGLLGDQEEQVRQQMQQQGLLGLAAGLFEAGAPSRQRQSLGGSAIRGLMAGQQAAQGTFDQALKAMQLRQQMEDAREKRKREQQMREAIAGSYDTRPVAGLGIGADQLSYMAPEIEAFGTEGIAPAAAAVAPTERVINRDRLLSAIANFAPEKYLELTQPEKAKESFRPLTKQEQVSLGLPADQPFQISSSGKISQVGQTPSAIVKIGPGETETQKGYAKFGVEKNTEIFESGQRAAANIPKIDQTLDLLKTGDPRTGLGAEIVKNVDRVRVAFTGSKKSIKSVSDTELLNALLGSEVFPQIGALGIGARGLDTPAEREFLREVMTGTITMNRDTLIRLTELRKKYEQRSVDAYNNAVKSGQLDDLFRFSNLPKKPIDIQTNITVDY